MQDSLDVLSHLLLDEQLRFGCLFLFALQTFYLGNATQGVGGGWNTGGP